MSKNILLTGYEPFDQFQYNPSQVIARTLDGTELAYGYTIRGAVLPVDCERMPGVLKELWQRHEPGLVVGLGLAFGESGIRLERTGLNRLEINSPDNGGHTRQGEPVIAGGPTAYTTTLPLDAIRAALLAEGLPAYLSDSAGGQLCNMMLYTALHTAAHLPPETAPQCGFIHVGAVPQMVANRITTDPSFRTAPSMSIELMQQAILIALGVASTRLSEAHPD